MGSKLNLLKILQKVLIEDKLPNRELITEDSTLMDTATDNSDAKVINNDIERTRVKDRKDFPDFKYFMEKLISYYLVKENIRYKVNLLFNNFLARVK